MLNPLSRVLRSSLNVAHHSGQIDAPESGPCPGKITGRVLWDAEFLDRALTTSAIVEGSACGIAWRGGHGRMVPSAMTHTILEAKMLDRPWTTDSDEVVAAQFLDWLATAQQGGLVTNVGDFEPTDNATADEETLTRVFAGLKADGLLRVEQSLGGLLSDSVRLSDSGVARQRRLVADRADGTARDLACEGAMLDWLVNWVREHPDSGSSWDSFVSDPRGHFWGEPFAENETTRASGNLRARGLIDGVVVNESDIVFRAKPTAQGTEEVRRASGLVQSSETGHTTVNYTQNFQGTVSGQVVQGDSANLVQNVGIQPERLDDLLEDVRALIGTLPEIQQPRAAIWVDAISEESSNDADQAALVTFGDRLKSVASKGGSAAFAAAVGLLVKALYGEIGL